MVTKMQELQLQLLAIFGQHMPKMGKLLSMKMSWRVFFWTAWYVIIIDSMCCKIMLIFIVGW